MAIAAPPARGRYSDGAMVVVKQAGAIAIRDRDGRVETLIVRARKDPTKWIFPKGHIERGESAAEAAGRELEEEAGVKGWIVHPVGMSVFTSGDEQVEVTYYLARFVKAVPQSESRECRWLPIDEARRTLSFDDTRRLLDAAVRELTGG